MDLHDLVKLHFPNLSTNVMDRIFLCAYKYMSVYGGENMSDVSKSFITHVSEKLIRCIIHDGSSQENHDNDIECILSSDEYSRRHFKAIVDQRTFCADLFGSAIVPTCRDEFDKTDDWRVKESSLLATQISIASNGQLDRDCIKYVLSTIRQLTDNL